MEAVFSKLQDSKIALNDQEFYKLRLWDSANNWKPEFMVMQSRATWREVDRHFKWDDSEVERFLTLENAEVRYAALAFALTERGFVVSRQEEGSWFPRSC